MPATFTGFTEMIVHSCVFPFRLRFTHNLASRDRAETLIVELRTKTGASGYGQALPRTYLTGESLETAREDMAERWLPALRNMHIPENANFTQLLECFRPLFLQADSLRKNASCAAVECAAFDAVLRDNALPAADAEMAGMSPIPLVGVIGAAAPLKAWLWAKALRAMGYARFKVKVGENAPADAARLRAVRSAAGANSRLSVDANGAWDPDEARKRMRALRDFGVALVEEPLRRDAARGFDYLRLERDAGIPVMADESLCTVDDAKALLEAGSPSHWNLRYAKNGGFCGLSALSALARDSGVLVYGGVLAGETGVLAAAGRAGMFHIRAECGEYGFPRILLKGDPFRGSPAGCGGVFPPPPAEGAGLGVRAVPAALEKSRTSVVHFPFTK